MTLAELQIAVVRGRRDSKMAGFVFLGLVAICAADVALFRTGVLAVAAFVLGVVVWIFGLVKTIFYYRAFRAYWKEAGLSKDEIQHKWQTETPQAGP